MRQLLSRLVSRGRAPGPPALDPPAGEEGTSAEGPSGTSRRTLITRGLWVVAGAVGVGVAGTSVATGSRTAPAAAGSGTYLAPAGGPVNLSLFVRDVRFTAPGLKAGALPAADVLWSPNGQLVDAAGALVGRFSGGVLPGAGGQIAVQRFTFSDGSLIGMGSGLLDGEEYAVVGGTGRFAGAIGSYVATIKPGEFGRDAEFVINLTGKKG